MSAARAPDAATIEIVLDGRALRVDAGITVAAALLNAGVVAFRASRTGEPRAPLCGMGVCQECRVRIDGEPHQRACLAVTRAGMRVDTAMDSVGGAP
jgi:predicted molibdopterin-dependent oxidoreductase YjgC